MSILRWLSAGFFMSIAMSVAGAQPAQADPLTPLTPAELQYLEQVRAVLTVSHNNAAQRSDGELLVVGRDACTKRASHNVVGTEANLITPAVTQLAFIYLCPG